MKVMHSKTVLAGCCAVALAFIGCGPRTTNSVGDGDGSTGPDVYVPPECDDGIDEDGDGYGEDCPAGPDCDDTNPSIHPNAPETCNGLDDDCDGQTDEGVLNACGNCNPSCTTFDMGNGPFPLSDTDPNVEDNGVGLDPNGDLILDESNVDFNFLWIANRYDAASRGTVSKIDSTNLVEVGRYYTVTCFGNPAYQQGQCLDVAGNPIQIEANHPSRTAVDYNFDVWAANRAFGGQPSASKIANNISDCIDRNGNGVIDTSQDHDGDGAIDIDCDSNGQPDDITTTCTAAHPPEFLGHDDECVLHTTNYGATDELGRSVCLDAGDVYSNGAGNAWVGTYTPGGNGFNEFYKLNGMTGQIDDVVILPSGVSPYGCAVDSEGILWTVGGYHGAGRLAFFDTANTVNIGPVLQEPYTSDNHFYGIAMDSDGSVWIAGWATRDVFRYRPDRTDFATLSQGQWTRIRSSENGSVSNTRGIGADLRGWIWVASNNGYILRLPQAISDGDHSWTDAVNLGAWLFSAFLGDQMIGAGIDFDGHVWGISYGLSQATRIDLDQNGNPVDLNNNVWTVPVGANPYTYSDFTGYGLANFTRPRGTYKVKIPGCADPLETKWLSVEWNSTEPPDTAVKLRVRTGDDGTIWNPWFGQWDASPADLLSPPPGNNDPLAPNPAPWIQVEFELSTADRETTPILHDFTVIWECEGFVPQ